MPTMLTFLEFFPVGCSVDCKYVHGARQIRSVQLIEGEQRGSGVLVDGFKELIKDTFVLRTASELRMSLVF
jgi:hypothetical protein